MAKISPELLSNCKLSPVLSNTEYVGLDSTVVRQVK